VDREEGGNSGSRFESKNVEGVTGGRQWSERGGRITKDDARVTRSRAIRRRSGGRRHIAG
jgi:hypothetical protein